MKIKHNKKRNTAFVYEALVREKTVAVLRGDVGKQQKIVEVLRRHFRSNGVLQRDLNCYRSIYEGSDLDISLGEKILNESKMQKRLINPDELFEAQTKLIHDINKTISPELFANFVPNYKSLATIDQIFSLSTNPKDRVILENQILETMQASSKDTVIQNPVDDIVYRSFVKKFNEKYENELLEEQKKLLSYYISSFTDNALTLKTFLNEEIGRLREAMITALKDESIKNDPEMAEKSKKIHSKLESFASSDINEALLSTVLKTQKLVKEIQSNGSDN
jgi:hypothetical protein